MTAATGAPPRAALDGLVNAFQASAWSDLEARALAITEAWPHAAVGWKALGLALVKSGRTTAAVSPLDQALKLTPNDAELHFYLAEAQRKLGRLDQAVASYQAIVRLRPTAEAHNNLGGLLFTMKEFAGAAVHFGEASALQPEVPHHHANHGIALRHLGKVDEAEAAFRRALALDRDDSNSLYSFGNLLRDAGRLEQAEEPYRRAIVLEPGHVKAMTNLAQTLADLGRSAEALELLRAAIVRHPDYALPHANKSLIDLRLGNFREGWRGYEWRWRDEGFPTPNRNLPQPLWLGKEPITGRTIAVHWEQGLGDTIQFCRYLPMLAAKGARVLFAPQDELHGLMAGLAGEVELVGLRQLLDGQRQCDYQVPLLSLPLAFRTDAGSIPAAVPYLRAEPDRIARWRSRLGDHGFKIGICWQGRSGKEDHGRSFPLACFAGLARLPGVRLISLHKGEGEAQLASLPEGITVEMLGDNFDAGPGAFLDTAAVMTLCDLVVTSDTAVAHLAGALSVRTWVVLKAVPDWRWMVDRPDTPWYPKMRLFRQTVRGEWESVFREIESEVPRLIDAPSPSWSVDLAGRGPSD